MVLPVLPVNQTAMTPTAPPAYLMASQQNVSTGMPIIPNPYIEFIVVNGDERSMIRCKYKSILENSVELEKLIRAGPNSGRRGDNHFLIKDVDKIDFELVIRYLEDKVIRYRDHLHLLKLLDLAVLYKCPDLILFCVSELDLHLSSETVIPIYRHIRYFQNASSYAQQNQIDGGVVHDIRDDKLKKRSKTNIRKTNANPFTPEAHLEALLANTLQLIDMQAEMILTEKQIIELRFEELETIVKRETLQLMSEFTLFTCLANWSAAECKRKRIDPTDEKRRCVLGGLCYAPRYLLMNKADFQKACDRVELLDPVEIQLVREAIDGKKPRNLSSEQIQLLDRFRTQRADYAEMPIHLSDRSNHKNYPKGMRKLGKSTNKQDESCWENLGLNCLAAFACLFD